MNRCRFHEKGKKDTVAFWLLFVGQSPSVPTNDGKGFQWHESILGQTITSLLLMT